MLMLTTSRRWRIVAAAAIALLVPATAAPVHAAPPDDPSILAKALTLQQQLYKTKKAGVADFDDGDPGGQPIAAGGDVSCAAGFLELWCWGAGNAEPEAPTNALANSAGPVTAGGAHQCVLELFDDSDVGGDLYCWGDNTYGQVGDGTTTARPAPVKVRGGVLQVAAGADHTCAILVDRSLVCWGRDDAGQLGQGAAGVPVTTPQAVPGLDDLADVAAGGDTTCALDDAGAAWCWGSNSDGQVGDGTAGATPVATPTSVDTAPLGSDDELGQIEVGARHTCAVTYDERVWCWGADGHGQLGDDPAQAAQNLPVDTGLEAAWMVTAGGDSTCAVIEDGQGWCWGDNTEGQLGTGDHTDRAEPAKLDQSGLTGSSLYEYVFGATGGLLFGISMGERHACGMDVAGNAYCWGDNAGGQLGDGTTTDRLRPTATLLRPGAPRDVDTQARDAEIGVDWTSSDELGLGPVRGSQAVAFTEEGGFGSCSPGDSTSTGCTISSLTNDAEYLVFVSTMTTGGMATAEPVAATPLGMASPAPVAGGGGGQLPITGAAVSLLIAIGGGLVMGGMALRRRARERRPR
ncbi:hypothetical protein [Actinoplanes sp. NPDC089786]|uniref:RCC1 domain-containing protein n=1 Tax=Actinoplanes sp. NPDC089786 TaxID=3155185 RepID=UPI003435F7A2